MTRLGLLILLLAAASVLLTSQTLRFEVASVKPNLGSAGTQTWGFLPSGRFVATNTPLRLLIQNAYELSRHRLLGGPGWIDTERFDILGSAPEGTSEARMLTMLQTLLADRFNLVLRREAREMAAYSLVIASNDRRSDKALVRSADCEALRNQLKIVAQTTGGPGCSWRVIGQPANGLSTYQSGGVDLNEFANTLASYVGRPVIDRTGLDGLFEFELSWLQANQTFAPASANDGPSLFTALQEQLGLKLEPNRGPVEVLVIESVERPTPD